MEEKLRRKVKAGKVFKGMQVRVVDPEWEADVSGAEEEPPSAATDEVGELWVRGDNLFIGYWRRPEETAKVMHRGWFRTGDLGSIDGNGYVSVSDRKKDMIISGGENIFSIGTLPPPFLPARSIVHMPPAPLTTSQHLSSHALRLPGRSCSSPLARVPSPEPLPPHCIPPLG